MSKRIELLIIDPQHDFCDSRGTLFVPGAEDDMFRLGDMISKNIKAFSDIHVTLDSHRRVDIAHPIMWVDDAGKNPSPFTIISASDVENGVWRTLKPSLNALALKYVQSLAEPKPGYPSGRYPLCIWPEHCLIGTVGQTVVPQLMGALHEWEGRFAAVDFVTKGSNIFTEHYSAVMAEVPMINDPTTQLNVGLISTLENADVVAIAGEASSHCLANTVRDIVANFADPKTVEKLVLLTDATSPVTGFEQFETDFVAEMTALGMKTSTTVDFLA